MESFCRITTRWSFLVLIFIVLMGCKSTGSKPEKDGNSGIQGTWVIDLEALRTTPEFVALSNEQQKVMMDVSTKLAEAMVFTITENEFRIRTGEKEDVTSYTVKSRQGNEWLIDSVGKSGVQEENKVRIHGDHLYLSGKDTEFTLKRQKRASK